MKRILAVLLSVICIISLIGCGSKSDSAIIYYGVKTPPTTIDPQLAVSVTELTIVKNIYEGLLRLDAEGNPVPAAATYTKNGLTYTFTISENAFWSNGEKVISDDFLFGLTRALSPETKAPEASSLFSIKNAESFLNGDDVVLGIKAPDEKTLIIELQYDDENFLTTLTNAIAMPCNRKFFKECIGKYGMSGDTVLSNGSFKLTKWATEDFAMRLHKNSKYSGDFPANSAAIFLSVDKKATVIERLVKNSIDVGEIESNEIAYSKENGLSVITLPNTIWMIKFGDGYSMGLKDALVSSLQIYNPNFNSAPNGITLAKNLYPDMFSINLETDFYNLNSAKTIYEKEITQLPNKKFPTAAIYYQSDSNITELLKSVVGHWQQNLGIYINIESLPNKNSVKSKENDYSITIYNELINTQNKIKYASFFNAEGSSDLKAHIKNGNIFPIAYSGTVISYSENLKNIVTNGDINLIDFSFVNKMQ